jgi:putative DNA methylase
VDDPSARPDLYPTESEQDAQRQKLFKMIEELVKWENSNNANLLADAREAIEDSTGGNPPAVYDPFCGSGSIPIEAQRLGLRAFGSDLNPVAVLITKALVELPSRHANRAAINPKARERNDPSNTWVGLRGLSDDIKYYGRWVQDQARLRVGHLYEKATRPSIEGTASSNIMTWLWARTITCPNPACGACMPLLRSFALSTKPGKVACVEPVIDHGAKTVRFNVKAGAAMTEPTRQKGKSTCLVCKGVINDAALRAQCREHGIKSVLVARVVQRPKGVEYLDAGDDPIPHVPEVSTPWLEQPLPDNARWFSPPGYGLTSYSDLFTARQKCVLSTFCELIDEVRGIITSDGADESYADSVVTYLSLAVSRLTDFSNSICSWDSGNGNLRQMFARQAIPMAWDYAESNLLDGTVNFGSAVNWVISALPQHGSYGEGSILQLDAATADIACAAPAVATDPPYYDNIGYADLSDFFYIWLRRCLANIYPGLFSTLLVPKVQELIASPYRFHGSKDEARRFFETGFGKAFEKIRAVQNQDYPLTVFYAFKQSEETEPGEDGVSGTASTGWETMLEGLIRARFKITGTWPMRTEQQQRSVAYKTNALASSIVLACRPRPETAPVTTRRDFLAALKKELPHALRNLQQGNIAPVDLAQAAIGPGMAVFSQFEKVLESDGSPMRVRTALGLINQTLDEVLSEQEGELDPDTRWALAWFEQHAFDDGLYGEAELLATAKALSVAGLDETRIIYSHAGKVRLLRRDELAADWNPSSERRLTVWAVTQQLIRSLDKNGEMPTATLASKVGGLAESARDLAYRLYILSERKGWAEEAGYYNSLVVSWPAIAPKAFALR